MILVLQERQNKMRIVLTGLCLAIFQFIFSQKDFQKELSLGVNGGVTFSSISFTPSIRQNKLIQGVEGLSLRYISESNVGLLFEINYSQRGWTEYDPDHPEEHYTRTLNYLECPAFTHVYYNTGKHFRVIANLGPQAGYLLNEQVLESNVVVNQERTQYHTLKAQRRFDWGLCFGGGVELQTEIGNFMLDGRYYYGLSDVFKNSRADYFASSSNQIINVKLTYLFKL